MIRYADDYTIIQYNWRLTIMQERYTTELPRTTLTLAISVKDKKKLQRMAFEQDTTAAALIHEWILEHDEKDGE